MRRSRERRGGHTAFLAAIVCTRFANASADEPANAKHSLRGHPRQLYSNNCDPFDYAQSSTRPSTDLAQTLAQTEKSAFPLRIAIDTDRTHASDSRATGCLKIERHVDQTVPALGCHLRWVADRLGGARGSRQLGDALSSQCWRADAGVAQLTGLFGGGLWRQARRPSRSSSCAAGRSVAAGAVCGKKK